MLRQSTRAVLVLCLLFAASAVPFAAAAEFSDVPNTHWAWSYIQGACDAGVVQGYPGNMYHPEYQVTRDQMAVYLARALAGGEAAVPTGPEEANFNDVATDHWAFKYIEYVASPAVNVVQGYPGGNYKPDQVVTRGQMAVYIARAMVSPSGDAALPDPTGDPTFPDVTADDANWSWCYKQVEYLVGLEVVTGYWDGYHPEREVTRDQMAVYICRAFDLTTPTASYDIGNYFPTTEGDNWVYVGDGGGYQTTVSGTADVGGDTYARFLDSDGDGMYWLVDDDGLHLGGAVKAGDPDSTTVTFDPAFTFPRLLPEGSTATLTAEVSADGSVVGDGTFTYTVIGLESIMVPAGTFANCLKLEMVQSLPGDDEQHFYIWFAPGVGQVKMDGRPFGGTQWNELMAATIDGVMTPAQSYHVSDYWPLGQGDTWHYDLTGSGWSDTRTLTVSGTTTLGGRVYSNVSDGEDIEYWRATGDGVAFDGVYSTDEAGQFAASPEMLFPNSLELGDSNSGTSTVTFNGAPAGTMPWEFTFVGIETVTVPAGTFPYCMKITFTKTPPGSSGEEISTYWLASGIGAVKIVNAYPDDTETWELTSATIGGNELP